MNSLTLKALQQQFSQSLLYQDSGIEEHIKDKQGFSVEQLIQIHRNNFVISVSESLQCTYANTLLLVGEEFFSAAARQFILTQPPTVNNICEYGEQFPDYLSSLPQLVEIPYVAEMAKFEHIQEQSKCLPINTQQIDLTKLQEVSENDYHKLLFSVADNCLTFASQQNIQLLNSMINNNDVQAVDLDSPCYLLLSKQVNFDIVITELTEQQWQLIQQLKAERCLDELQPSEIQSSLPALFAMNIISAFSLAQ